MNAQQQQRIGEMQDYIVDQEHALAASRSARQPMAQRQTVEPPMVQSPPAVQLAMPQPHQMQAQAAESAPGERLHCMSAQCVTLQPYDCVKMSRLCTTCMHDTTIKCLLLTVLVGIFAWSLHVFSAVTCLP